jgi:hypothetical protein
LSVALALLLFWSCKTEPPAPKTLPKEEKNKTATAVETPAEEERPPEQPEEPPQIVVRAEEVTEPLDKDADVDLVEPVYNLNEPEVVEGPEQAPPAGDAADATAALDEPVEKPTETAASEPVKEAEPPAEAETDGPAGIETEESAPPPPPAVALRPSEAPERSQPVPEKAPEAVRAEPVLPARNPPTETERYVKPALSRTINVSPRQNFEIPFAETGWVYTGEENSKNGINYDSRRVSAAAQIFVFRAEKEGEYTLKFYRQDFLRDNVANEYIRVIVKDAPPSAEAPFPVAPASSAPPSAEDAETPAPPPSAGLPATPADLLREAREAVAAKKYPDAIALLDRLGLEAALSDEAWWLYGQAFEAASPSRDIRSALDAYTVLVRDYPQSVYYKPAQNRIAFLNRFYFNIR